MAGKAGHKKKKPYIQSKRVSQHGQPAALVPPAAVTQNREPSPPPRVAAPTAKAAAPMVKSATIPYPHITTELWTIGVLAVIMLVILFVLAIVPLPW
jgi:hypothetical protein